MLFPENGIGPGSRLTNDDRSPVAESERRRKKRYGREEERNSLVGHVGEYEFASRSLWDDRKAAGTIYFPNETIDLIM